MFSFIVEWLQDLIVQTGPIGIFLATFIESLFAPIPSEIILVTAGTALVSPYSLVVYIISSTLGSYAGTLPFYILGKKSEKVVHKFIDKWGNYLMITEKQFEWSRNMFEKRQEIIVLTGRLIPGVRSLISIPAGLHNMDFVQYSLYTIIGSGLWNTILLGIGFIIKDKVELALSYVDQYEKFVILLILLFGIFYSIVLLRKNLLK